MMQNGTMSIDDDEVQSAISEISKVEQQKQKKSYKRPRNTQISH
jgi:hypothetical protein